MVPDNMTIKQAVDAGLSTNFNEGSRSLFDILGMEAPKDVYDINGVHRSRFAPMYKKWSGWEMPKRINKIFWVGVEEGNYDSKPIKRSMTSCFSPRPVFLAGSKFLFDMRAMSCDLIPSDDLYEIPICEEWALQVYDERESN